MKCICISEGSFSLIAIAKHQIHILLYGAKLIPVRGLSYLNLHQRFPLVQVRAVHLAVEYETTSAVSSSIRSWLSLCSNTLGNSKPAWALEIGRHLDTIFA